MKFACTAISNVTIMGALCRKYSRNRLLLVTCMCGVLLCLSFIWIQDRWSPRQMPFWKHLLKGNVSTWNPKDSIDHHYWKTEYETRVQRTRKVCEANKNFAPKRSWNVASNRHSGNITHCSTNVCPIIADDQKLFFCFIPKVASTHIKKFLLNMSNIDYPKNDNSALHIIANDALRRVSPAYYSPTQLNRFYKIMFVRHPFDRLVSAFRSKAEQPRSKMGYFYSRYWDSIMKKLRPKGSISDRISFKEFVWYLTHTSSRDYDIHWAPFWNRCETCFLDYDFIGKLETAQNDFPYAFRKAGIRLNPVWWSDYPSTNRTVTLRYFESIPDDMIRKLYEIYKPDFELFGYSANEFLSPI